MPYFDEVRTKLDLLLRWAELRHEQGSGRAAAGMERLARHIASLSRGFESLVPPAGLRRREPDDLEAIRALRRPGPRRLWERFDADLYEEKVAGAWLARAAGCTLGTVVEGWEIARMEDLARYAGTTFPPEDYWTYTPHPYWKRYNLNLYRDYLRRTLRHIPVDDDLAYTLLGLLILEDAGPQFTTADVARLWLKHLPMACTAEKVALENLQAGLDWPEAGERGNPYVEWIGADIRADPWGYAAPGWPEKAAELAHRDAILSHRRNGIYGAMYFAAAISAAFAVDDPLDACRIALTEIPSRCRLHADVTWALRQAPRLRDFRHARQLVDDRFPGMHKVHTDNNACLTIFGLALGGRDVTRVIGNTVAMGLDNDCTAATAGSIVGAVVGQSKVPRHWTSPFHNRCRTYLRGREWFTNTDIVRRFGKAARTVWEA